MNWNKLVAYLEESLRTNEGKKVLLTSRYIYLNNLLVGLLKLLLDKKKGRGIYIAVDRPYHYTSRILEKKGVPLDKLFFLDVISAISSERLRKAKNVVMVDGPFCNTMLVEALDKLEEMEGADQRVDFVFLDNVTVMLNYLDIKCMNEIIQQFVIRLSKEGELITLVVVDKDAHPNTYKRVREKSDVEIEVNESHWT